MYDFRLSRVSIFVDSGFVRSTPITPSDYMTPVAARPVGLLADGRSIFAGGAAIALGDPGPARIERESRPVVHYDSGGAPRQLIGTFPGAELEVAPISSGPLRGRGFARGTRIFGRGSAIVLSGSHVVVADNATFKLDFHDQTGRLVQSIRWQLVQDSVRSSDLQAYIAERSARITNATARANLERALQAATPSPTYPAFEPEVIVDPTGSLWVGEYRRPGQTEQMWWVFDSGGALVRQVAVPRALAVRDAGPDYIMGVWRDADGVESVRVYGLEPTAAGQPVRR